MRKTCRYDVKLILLTNESGWRSVLSILHGKASLWKISRWDVPSMWVMTISYRDVQPRDSNTSLSIFNSLSYAHVYSFYKNIEFCLVAWRIFWKIRNVLISLVKLCRVNFGCAQSPMKHQVSWDYKELYLRDDILLGAAPKMDSGTRAMSSMTDLLLNLQCSKCLRQTLEDSMSSMSFVGLYTECVMLENERRERAQLLSI